MRIAIAILSVVFVCASATVETRRGVTKHVVGTPAGTVSSSPTAINNKGVVLGATFFFLADGSFSWTPFLWSAKTGFNLFLDHPAIRATPTDINDRGEVVGWYEEPFNPEGFERGFFWSASQGFINLGRFFPTSINDRAEMAGYCETFDAQTFRARFPCAGHVGEIRALATPSDGEDFVERGRAAGINERGEVVGSIWIRGVGDRPAFWSTTGAWTLLPVPPGHDNSRARAINEHGEIIGQLINEFTPSFAIAWTPSHEIRWISRPNNDAFGIAANGTIAGTVVDEHGQNPRAILVHRDDTLIDLGPGFATGLNDKRQVIGFDVETSSFAIWTIGPQLFK